MQIVQWLTEDLWQEFVDKHPQSNIFQTPQIYQVFAQTRGYQPTLWATVDDHDHPLALLLPVQITLMDGLLRWLTTRAVVYGSLLCAPGLEGQEALPMLLRAYQHEMKGSILFTELRNLSDLSYLQPVMKEYGLTYEEHLNIQIDLSLGQEATWKNIHSNAKRNIKKALKSQVIIEEVDNLERMSAVYALLKNTYMRLEVPLADRSLFLSAFEILYPQNMFKAFIAKVGNIDIGVMQLLLHKDIVYYWYAGMVKEYSSYRVGDLLVWHALEWGCQNGFHLFDFGGAGKPNEDYGVRNFKAKFGGQLVNYGRNICVHEPVVFGISKTAYSLTRKFLSLRRKMEKASEIK